MNNDVSLRSPATVSINLGDCCHLSGEVGVVLLADGRCLAPLASAEAQECREVGETPCGTLDRLCLSGRDPGGMSVRMVWSVYREQPVLEVEMTVRNDTEGDLLLDRLVLLRGLPMQGGFAREFARTPYCRFLAQPFHWPGHFEVRNYIQEVPADASVTAYWSTVIGETGRTALAVGIGETARGGAEITLHGAHGMVGLEIASTLRSDRHGRCLRLPAGAEFTTQRMVLALGPDPAAALERYSEFVCRRIGWQLRFPPYAGLFTAYGNDPENGDPGKLSLTEERLATLMQVVDGQLRPYGLDTIKTQFHGHSSSRPGDGAVRKFTAAEATDPEKVRQLIDSIHEKAFAPDDYDSRQDFPHGIAWHVQQLAARGYRPALVCRPFYNIEAGTPALDAAAAELFARC